MSTYYMEKVLYFASQKPDVGFNVRDSERTRKTDLWRLVAQASDKGWLVKAKGTEQWFLTLGGYQQLLREKLVYHTHKKHTEEIQKLNQTIESLQSAFIDGVYPKTRYTQDALEQVIARETPMQALSQFLASDGLMLSLSSNAPALTEIADAGWVSKSEFGYQITHDGIQHVFEQRAAALKVLGQPLDHLMAESERLSALLTKIQASIHVDVPETVLWTQDMQELLVEAYEGVAVAPDVLFFDESRRPEERNALLGLLAAKSISMAAEDDAGTYYKLTEAGRQYAEERIGNTKQQSLKSEPGTVSQAPSQAQNAMQLSIKDMPEEVMQDLSLYRLFMDNLVGHYLTQQEIENINELAVDVAFSDGVDPFTLVESWVKNREQLTHSSQNTELRERGIALATLMMGSDIATKTVLPINEFVESSKIVLGTHIPYHDADSILREAQRRSRESLSQEAAPVSKPGRP